MNENYANNLYIYELLLMLDFFYSRVSSFWHSPEYLPILNKIIIKLQLQVKQLLYVAVYVREYNIIGYLFVWTPY